MFPRAKKNWSRIARKEISTTANSGKIAAIVEDLTRNQTHENPRNRASSTNVCKPLPKPQQIHQNSGDTGNDAVAKVDECPCVCVLQCLHLPRCWLSNSLDAEALSSMLDGLRRMRSIDTNSEPRGKLCRRRPP